MDLLLANATTGEQIVWYMGYFGPDILYKQGAPLPAQPGWAVQP